MFMKITEKRSARAKLRALSRGAPRGDAMEESPFKGKTGLRRLWNAFGYSLHGFSSAFRHEDAFRQEVLLALVLIPIALLIDASATGKALMIAAVLLVLIVELLNSAIEAAVDRISLDHHRLAKRAKDIGSAAVFLSLVNVLIVWALVISETL
jgi:diacylglycerol kinase (ATP)